jgi:poly(3-hydroxybutyrate) depolymerase
MSRILLIVFLKCLLLLSEPVGVCAQVASLTHDDVRRRYVVYTPASYESSPDRQYAVVLNFHGGGMTMAEQMLYSAMNRTADRHDSAEESMRYWTARNRLVDAGTTLVHFDRDPDDGTSIRIHETAEGAFRVALITVHDGGHTWSGADPFNIGLPIGRTSAEIDLNEVIWRFFALHRR